MCSRQALGALGDSEFFQSSLPSEPVGECFLVFFVFVMWQTLILEALPIPVGKAKLLFP